jgi:uncharacterized protein involved in exopolysaccharide biosynthesis
VRLRDPQHDLTAAELLRLIWQRKSELIAAIVLGFLIGGGVSLILYKKYESRASFIGVGGSKLNLQASLGGLAALATQLGVTGLGGTDAASLSPYFYADLVTADTILTQLATVPLRTSADTTLPARPLLQLLHVNGRSRADSVQRAVRKLRRMLVVDLQTRTGVVKLTFTARNPYLAAAAADTLLGLVNGFVGRDLRTRAGATRRFLQDRLTQVQAELGAQGDKLKTFLENNREYRNSPSLQFKESELQRDLEFWRELYLSVARSLEEARMNEVRDTPSISIIDRPSVPARPSSPKPLLNAVLLALFMPAFWLAWVLSRRRQSPMHEANPDRA